MVEGARLESVYRGNSIQGSNPCLSATTESITYKSGLISACNGVQRRCRIGSIIALNLYRRHNQECDGGHPEGSHSGELEERSKKWKRCGCPIVAAGSMNKIHKRLKTGQIFWPEARSVTARWEASGRWPDDANPSPAVEVLPDTTKITIERAISAYLADHKDSAPNTVKQYGYTMEKLRAYSAHKGYSLIEQWTPVDIRASRDTWGVAVRTANNYMAIVRAPSCVPSSGSAWPTSGSCAVHARW